LFFEKIEKSLQNNQNLVLIPEYLNFAQSGHTAMEVVYSISVYSFQGIRTSMYVRMYLSY
jgi:hypothetical protein